MHVWFCVVPTLHASYVYGHCETKGELARPYVVRLVQVGRLQVRAVPWVEATPVGVELVTEDELPLLPGAEVDECVRVL